MVFLCTGNAARSVMAGCIMRASGVPARILTAGTHVVENQPMSRRTKSAILSLGIDPGHHRSHQLTDLDVKSADLVVAMAPEHVQYIRRLHPYGAPRAATIWYLAANLSAGAGPFNERVASLALAYLDAATQREVPDPAGGEESEYLACAKEISALMDQLLSSLRS